MSENKSVLEALAEGTDAIVSSEEGAPLPGMEQIEQAKAEVDEQGAAAVAAMGVNFLADAAEAGFDCLRYGPETRQEGAEKIAPLLLKYGVSGGVLGQFLERWKDEIAAGMFFGGVIWASVKLVREANAKQPEAPPPAANVTPLTMGDGISGD